jgi:signal transduction histidine kinase
MLLNLSKALRESGDAILQDWLKTLGEGSRPTQEGLTETELLDHMGQLLEDLCDQLQLDVNVGSEASARHHAEAHGDTRWTQRFQLRELLKEIGSLRTVVIEYVVRHTSAAPGIPIEAAVTAHKIVHRFFDAFMADSASLFAARHEHAMSERQRENLAQELHDGVCQHLQGTSLLVSVLSRKLTNPALRKDCEKLVQLLSEGMDSVRNVAHGLSPVAVHMKGGLEEALHELAASTASVLESRIDCSKGVKVEPGVALHLYRIAQEAVANALKHSGAKNLAIELSERDSSVVLKVADDGCGFLANSHERKGIGLHSIRHRAHAIGGKCLVQSAPGAGTCIICTAPRESSGVTEWR